MAKRLIWLIVLLVMASIPVLSCDIGTEINEERNDQGDGDDNDGDIPDGDITDGDTPVVVLDGDEDTADGDMDGDVSDGDTTDGDVSDGDVSDGDATDGDVSDGDVSDGDVTDGDVSDGDVTDGDTSDGDILDGDIGGPDLQFSPNSLRIDGEPQDENSGVLVMTNVGDAPTEIGAFDFGLGRSSPFALTHVFLNDIPTNPPWLLNPADSLTVQIAVIIPPSPVSDTLEFDWSHPSGMRHASVPLVAAPGNVCARAAVSVTSLNRVGEAVRLDGSASVDPSTPNGNASTYRWTFDAHPSGAGNVEIINADGTDITGQSTSDAIAFFIPTVQGHYTVRLEVPNAESTCGDWASAQTSVDILSWEAIRVELTWSTVGNDHDLHLLQSGNPVSRSCQTGDRNAYCTWCNCNTNGGMATPCPPRGCPGPSTAPNWGDLNSRIDDPMMQIDDIQGTGPEIITFSDPKPGDYIVAVENFSGQSTNNVVSVRVYIEGQLSHNVQHDYFPQNSHWTVCEISVDDNAAITIVPIGLIETSSE